MPEPYSIFASVGNATQPFDRFVRMVDEAALATGLSTLIQTGACTRRPRHAAAVDFVPRSEFESLVLSAGHFITHAGAGSVMAAVRLGKVPIVMPRRKDLGEAVNDHQHELARELSAKGWVRVVSTAGELAAILLAPALAPIAHEGMTNRRMRELVGEFIG